MNLRLTGENGLLSNKRVLYAVVGTGIVLMLLLFLSSFISGSPPAQQSAEQKTAAQLETELEKRLEDILAQINGVSAPRVMVTLDTTAQRVFAEETKSSADSSTNSSGSSERITGESAVVLVGSAKEALEKSTVMPRVRGVCVVCGGASDPLIKEKVVNAVSGVLDLGASHIYVTE
ncbi:MAG: hypothetical protein ACI4KM_11720 [Oscillospiraceae bacterium]